MSGIVVAGDVGRVSGCEIPHHLVDGIVIPFLQRIVDGFQNLTVGHLLFVDSLENYCIFTHSNTSLLNRNEFFRFCKSIFQF